MFERGITQSEVVQAVRFGEIIEEYPDDSPYPSRLVLGMQGLRPIHVVVADNMEDRMLVVITVYEPDSNQWTGDFRRRLR
ncbi:MAG: DUF4258 domain-containing protein [Chloroflexi bacterium]|nr:DUF4258 domain-containing protein [Chloroflexota bacterium]